MTTKLFSLFAALLLFAACEGEDRDRVQTTENGTRYTYVTRNDDGQLAEAGDFIYFDAVLKTEGDSILIDTRANGGDSPVIQALSDSIVDQNTGPVEDVLRKVRVGEQIVIRTNLENFPSKPPGMENDSVLLYDITVKEIVGQDEFNARQQALAEEAQVKAVATQGREEERLAFTQQVYDDYKAGKLDDQLETAPSGVRYLVHQSGDGPEAEVGKGVVVQYIGRLTSNGEVFDQSFERGMGIPFALGTGRVIPGWDDGIDLLRQGDQATLVIPSELAYGAQGTPNGSIPPDSELMFYVELEEVQ